MTLFSVDTSAWHRSAEPSVAEVWKEFLLSDQLAICDQVRLEILWSTRSVEDYAALSEELSALRPIGLGTAEFRRALEVQAELARAGALHHRSVKIADLLVAAASEAAGATVLHYDADYDRIAAITGQSARWIAPRGSL